jgi:CRP/FNR family transcriptional regulator, cyclic AMP receptor protein
MSLVNRHLAGRCSDCEHRTLQAFCNLNDAALHRFDNLGELMRLPRRSVVFEEGQHARSVFFVCAGQLKLSTTSKDARTMIVRLAGPGDVLGLSAMLNNLAHEVTAETIEPTQLKSVPKQEFLEFLDTFSEVGKKTAEILAWEYRAVFLEARRLALSGSAAGKLAQLLIEWAHTAACGQPELRFTMALTHEELASMAGISRETATRLLNQFERNHLITRSGSSLTILNPADLSELTQ